MSSSFEYKLTAKYYVMKQAKIITALAFLSLSFFSNCKKDSSLVTPVDAVAANATINFHLVTVPQPANAILTFNSGYISLNSITFKGTHIVGNALHQDQFTTTNLQNGLLYQMINAGNVSVTSSKYDYASFLVTLKSNERYHSLMLNGSYINHLNLVIPVEIIIDNQIQLSSIWLDNVVLSAGTNYVSTLYLNMGQVAYGISSEQLNSASISDGVLLISSDLNSTLYNTILNNLASGLSVQFEPLSIINTSGSAVTLPNPSY